MDARQLESALEDAFGGTAAERRVVARQARDLVASGKPEADRGEALRAEAVVGHLADAPDGDSLSERWNWWMGALEMAYGGYRAFQIRVVAEEDGEGDRRTADADKDSPR